MNTLSRLRIDPSSAEWVKQIRLRLYVALESQLHGISVAGPKHEIANAMAFRLVETAFRGITRFPNILERIDVAIVMDEVPYNDPASRNTATRLLKALVREEINQQRIVAVEVRTPQRVLRQQLAEYWIMTPDQWANFQRTPVAKLGVASYRRALTSK